MARDLKLSPKRGDIRCGMTRRSLLSPAKAGLPVISRGFPRLERHSPWGQKMSPRLVGAASPAGATPREGLF